jgi:hypothetical protein
MCIRRGRDGILVEYISTYYHYSLWVRLWMEKGAPYNLKSLSLSITGPSWSWSYGSWIYAIIAYHH